MIKYSSEMDRQPRAKPRATPPPLESEEDIIDTDFLESLQEENDDIDLTNFL